MYCGFCGKKLDEGVSICPECGARTKNDINYCTNCGGLRKNKKKKACIFCKNSFNSNLKKSNNTTINNNRTGFTKNGVTKNKWHYLLGIIVIGFMFIFCVYGLYANFTATNGYYDNHGYYISVTQRHLTVPLNIVSVVILGIILIFLLKNFKDVFKR